MNKFEARNPKTETNSKIKCSKFKTKASKSLALVIWILVIQICFEFRYSSFGFIVTFSAYSIKGGPFLFIWCKSMQKKQSFEMKPLKHGIWLTVNRVWQPATRGGIK
jgi:hypothetical protein